MMVRVFVLYHPKHTLVLFCVYCFHLHVYCYWLLPSSLTNQYTDNACFYSPYIDTAITVGALSNDAQGANDKTASSNYGECIDIWAPGEDIAGATNSGEYDTVLKSGTSVAAAFVTGVASLFFEEINTAEFGTDELAARVKENVLYKAEINILDKIGHGSPNKIVQTTAVRCLVNSHCSSGLTCLRDGTCRDKSKPLKRIK